jgi:hypothetical protein
MIKYLLSFFAVLNYAATDDKNTDPATVITNCGATNVLAGLVGTTKFKNVLGEMYFPFNDSICGEKKIPVIFTRTTPVGDTDYASLVVGAIAIQVEITSTSVTAVNIFIKQGSGAYDWHVLLSGPASASATARTAEKKEVNIVGSNSGTGDYRGVYATLGSGDALRGYAITTGGANALRGAHLTAEVGTAGSVKGLAVGATCQFTTIAGLTLSAGTAACIDLVADLSSSVAGLTNAAFIRCSDNQSSKMTYFANIDVSSTGVWGSAGSGYKCLKIYDGAAVAYIRCYAAAG